MFKKAQEDDSDEDSDEYDRNNRSCEEVHSDELEGELNLNINGQPTVVGTGGSYQVKAGTVHAPTPNGEFCRYVMVGQPGGVESVFKSLKANQKDLNDMNKVVEIVTKEGVKIAG